MDDPVQLTNSDAVTITVTPEQLMALISDAGEDVLRVTSSTMMKSRNIHQNIIAIERAVNRLTGLIEAFRSRLLP